MKLVLTLLVRDEEDVIRHNLLYHLDRGVDFIIATDNLSLDATPDILADFVRQGVLKLIREEEDTYAQSRWVSRMARLAKTEYGADWVINGDADEFWWPTQGDLRDVVASIPEKFGVIMAPRHNFCPVVGDASPWYERMVYRMRVSLNPLGGNLAPKIIHRGLADVEIDQGNHHVLRPVGLQRFWERRVAVLHFPFRTPAQLKSKIAKGGAAYARNDEVDPDVGHCWRVLYDAWKDNGLADYVSQSLRSPDQIRQGIQDGSLIEDTRLRDLLRSLNGRD